MALVARTTAAGSRWPSPGRPEALAGGCRRLPVEGDADRAGARGWDASERGARRTRGSRLTLSLADAAPAGGLDGVRSVVMRGRRQQDDGLHRRRPGDGARPSPRMPPSPWSWRRPGRTSSGWPCSRTAPGSPTTCTTTSSSSCSPRHDAPGRGHGTGRRAAPRCSTRSSTPWTRRSSRSGPRSSSCVPTRTPGQPALRRPRGRGRVVPALGFEPRVDFDGPVDAVSDAALSDDALAVVREALSNTAKHARAGSAAVRLTASADRAPHRRVRRRCRHGPVRAPQRARQPPHAGGAPGRDVDDLTAGDRPGHGAHLVRPARLRGT